MNMPPDTCTRRSFVYRKLVKAGADFVQINGGAMAMELTDEMPELAQSMGLCDVSVLARTGFKGPYALKWMQDQGVSLESQANTAFAQTDGGLCAVLAPGEAVLLSPLSGDASGVENLDQNWNFEDADGTYKIPRANTNFEFIICGIHAAKMFAKICGIDLRPQNFANHTIAQTSVARTNSIIIRTDLGDTLAYRMLGDCASAEYMWECLLDAMNEFGGGQFGLKAVRSLQAP